MERKGFWMNFRTKAGVCRLWRNCWRRSMKPTQWTENLAVAKKDHCSAVPGDTRLYIPAAVAAQQFRLKSSWLSSLECTGGARLSLPYSWRRSPEESDWGVAALWPRDHRPGHQTVASTSTVVCPWTGRTFWTPTVAELHFLTCRPTVLWLFCVGNFHFSVLHFKRS